MKTALNHLVLICAFLVSNLAWAECTSSGDSNVQLQILGSGGPRDSDGRASSSYIVWIDGVSRIMVDSGSGTKVPFHQSGASFEQIDLVALSHFHPDHSAELPAVLWPRGGSFKISGPSARGFFPSLERFLDLMFAEGGAFHVQAERLNMEPITVDVDQDAATEVWRDDNILVRGISVPHGDTPAVGYRVDVGDYSIGFSSDQNGSNASYNELIKDVDVLVVHFGTSERSNSTSHAKPSVWGKMAESAGAGRVVVSHITTASTDELNSNLATLREHYTGPVTVAEDLLCVEVEDKS